MSATFIRLLVLSALFSLNALACSYFPPSYKVGNKFTIKVSSLEGTTLAGVRVILLRANVVANHALTDEQGKARFENVKAGDYSLEIDQLGTAGWDTATLEVADGLGPQDIELHWPSSRILRATEIKGTLLDSRTAKPLAATSLELVAGLSGTLNARLLTDDSGKFDLGSPEPGLYFIKVDPLRSGDWEPRGSIPILVVPKSTRELNLTLGESSCGMLYSEICAVFPITVSQLHGNLSDEEGAAINRAHLELVANSTQQIAIKSAAPDKEGHFSLTDVTTGEYQLRISSTGFAPLLIPITVASKASTDDALDVKLSVLGGACSTAKIQQPRDKAK